MVSETGFPSEFLKSSHSFNTGKTLKKLFWTLLQSVKVADLKNQKQHGQQVKGGAYASLLHSCEIPPGMLCSNLGSSARKDMDMLEQVQRRPQR